MPEIYHRWSGSRRSLPLEFAARYLSLVMGDRGGAVVRRRLDGQPPNLSAVAEKVEDGILDRSLLWPVDWELATLEIP